MTQRKKRVKKTPQTHSCKWSRPESCRSAGIRKSFFSDLAHGRPRDSLADQPCRWAAGNGFHNPTVCLLVTAFKADRFTSTASVLAFTSDCGPSSWYLLLVLGGCRTARGRWSPLVGRAELDVLQCAGQSQTMKDVFLECPTELILLQMKNCSEKSWKALVRLFPRGPGCELAIERKA